jgi:hypothetical protein
MSQNEKGRSELIMAMKQRTSSFAFASVEHIMSLKKVNIYCKRYTSGDDLQGAVRPGLRCLIIYWIL